MRYYSLNNNAPLVDFQEATIRGQAPDKGLYFPEIIPRLKPGLLESLQMLSKAEIAFEIIHPYVVSSIPAGVLLRICEETVAFDIPLVEITPSISSLELYHGPTLAFKDIGARFMSRCLTYFNRGNSKKITVLVATSGDTGSAVANGFLNAEGVDVVILYPSGKVSPIQEQQLTTLGHNITALEVEGDFDDCQRLVKQAFADPYMSSHLSLSSANSINVARWLSQQFYYFFALAQWEREQPPVFSVPCGNFGNLCAGLLAHISGMPCQQFIAACNSNRAVPEYLIHGEFIPQPTIHTISNAMDVGNPSNFTRILGLLGSNRKEIKKSIKGYSVSDKATSDTIRNVYDSYNYLLDPHGAVAYYCLEKYTEDYGLDGIILETAHPIKFNTSVELITGHRIPFPESLPDLMLKKKKSLLIKPEFRQLKEYLLSNVSA